MGAKVPPASHISAPRQVAGNLGRSIYPMGLTRNGTYYYQLRAGAIGSQVAGYYEPETGELVVRQAGAEPSAIDRITPSS